MKISALFAFVVLAVAANASASCWTCGLPPGAASYQCMASAYNGRTTCGTVLGSCVPAGGTCYGPSGDECDTAPHCGPQEKWVSSRPARPTQWQLASVELVPPAQQPAR